jgi:hypothetical protein
VKKIFKNENGSTGILYLVSNDMTSSAERLYEVYQKRWLIESIITQLSKMQALQNHQQRLLQHNVAMSLQL